MKRLIAKHDVNERTCAITYINGKIYEGTTHSECVGKYLNDNEDENFITEDLFYRKEIYMMTDDTYQIAFAHLLSEQKEIYLELKSLINVTSDQVILALKQKYPGFSIYDDDSYGPYGGASQSYYKIARRLANMQNNNITLRVNPVYPVNQNNNNNKQIIDKRKKKEVKTETETFYEVLKRELNK